MVKAEIKTAQGIHVRLAAAERIALRVGELVGHRGDFIAHQADIPVLPPAQAAQPALDVDFFARAVHFAVVKDVPAQRIGREAGRPAGIIPDVRGVQQHGLVRALAGNQVSSAGGDGETHGAIPAGGELSCAKVSLDGEARQGRAISQVSRPDDHVGIISIGIHADPGDLHPGLDGLGKALPLLVLCFEHPGRRLDDDDEVTKSIFQVRREFEVHFRERVIGNIERHDLVVDELARHLNGTGQFAATRACTW